VNERGAGAGLGGAPSHSRGTFPLPKKAAWRFDKPHLSVQDPLDPGHDLGAAVHWDNVSLLRMELEAAADLAAVYETGDVAAGDGGTFVRACGRMRGARVGLSRCAWSQVCLCAYLAVL
jgi:hypothetical protein